MRFLLAIFLLTSTTLLADVIPTNRLVNWSLSGISNGIPNVTTIFATHNSGTAGSTIRTSLGNCPSNQVVKLGAGTFDMGSSRLEFNDGVVFRGAGKDVTFIQIDAFLPFLIRGGNFNEGKLGTEVSLSANALQGATTLTVSSVPSWIFPGGVYGLDMLNDEVIASANTHREGAGTYRARTVAGSNGARGQGQSFKCIATNATTITMELPLCMDFTTTRTAQVFKMACDGNQFKWRVGIEDMTIVLGSTSSGGTITMENAAECWVSNVKISPFKTEKGIHGEFAYRCNVFKCDILDASLLAAGQGYGISLYDLSSWWRVENNITRGCHVSLQANYGSSPVVWGYNFCATNGVGGAHEDPSINVHGNAASFQLFEGNNVNGKIMADCIHGSNDRNVFFRNRVFGRNPNEPNGQHCIDIDYWNRQCSVVGNVCGTVGFHTTRLAQAGIDSCIDTSKIVFKFGYVNAYGCDATFFDSAATTDMIFTGNYDTVGGTIVWADANHTLTNSYYLSGAPSWFGNLTWPPINPTSPNTSTLTDTPAGYRYVNGSDPPTGGGSPPNITSATSATATNFVAYSYQITTDTTATSFGASGLPTGLSCNAGSGLISGTINIANTTVTNSVTLGATNANGGTTATLTLVIKALANPVITSVTNATGTVGAPITPYQIVATQYATNFGAANLPAGLSVAAATGLVTGTPSGSGTTASTIYATNAVGSDSENLEWVIAASGPVLTVSPSSLTFSEIVETQTSDLTIGVTNTGASGSTLNVHAHTTGAPFTVVAPTNFALAFGVGTNFTIRFSPTTQGLPTGSVIFVSDGGGATNAVSGTACPLAVGLTMKLTNALIAAPFTVNLAGDYISQTIETLGSPLVGGRASFGFTVPFSGIYTLSGVVDCVGTADDSAFLEFNNEPVAPQTEWNWGGPISFASVLVTRDEDGPPYPITFAHPFTLSVGINKVVIRGREPGRLRSITLIPPAGTGAVTNLQILSTSSLSGTGSFH